MTVQREFRTKPHLISSFRDILCVKDFVFLPTSPISLLEFKQLISDVLQIVNNETLQGTCMLQ